MPAQTFSIKLRPVELSDVDAVSRLQNFVGLSAGTPASWERLWVHNPALKEGRPAPVMGWVLETPDRIVGYLGNMPRLYRFNGRELLSANAVSFGVDPEFRGASMKLATAFARQTDVDLLLNTTAISEVGTIFRFLGFRPFPQGDDQPALYWVVNSPRFLAAALRKKGFPEWIAHPGGILLTPAHMVERLFGRRGQIRKNRSFEIRRVRPGMIGEDFDDLWRRISGHGNILLAYRSSEFLTWHFCKPGDHPQPVILGCYSGDRLMGYIAMVRRDNDRLRLCRSRVADIFVEGHDPDVTLALLDGALTAANEDGSCMLEIMGFPGYIRRCVSTARPYRLAVDHNPFWYKAMSPALADRLDDERVWYGSLFDGDGSV